MMISFFFDLPLPFLPLAPPFAASLAAPLAGADLSVSVLMFLTPSIRARPEASVRARCCQCVACGARQAGQDDDLDAAVLRDRPRVGRRVERVQVVHADR